MFKAILWYLESSSLGCNRKKEEEEAPPMEKKKEDTIINQLWRLGSIWVSGNCLGSGKPTVQKARSNLNEKNAES